MTIYLDIIFLENLFMNFIILYACEFILKIPIKIIRTFLASIIGSIYAVILYVTNLRLYSNIILKIALSVVIVYIAFLPKQLKSFLKYFAVFYFTSFTFGGVAFALLYYINSQKAIFEQGILIGTYPIKIIIIGGILGFILITIVFKSVKAKISKKDMFCQIKINIDHEKIYTNAIIDTGNLLHEPITKKPVIVVEKQVLKNKIPDNILNNLNNILIGEETNLGKYSSKIRVIPFTSLGKENGILLGLKTEKIEIRMEENSNTIEDVIIGIYDGVLNKNGKYHGLIGIDALEQMKEKKEV